MIIKALQYLLIAAFVIYGGYFIYKTVQSAKNNDFEEEKIYKPALTGFITNFFDTLGIGSFAPTMFMFKALRHNIPDKRIPGTLNVADCLPVLLEAIIFIGAVKVEPITLVCLIGASVVGSYLGAGIISKMSEKHIQLVMGVALLVSAGLFTAGVLGIMPLGGTARGLAGSKLIIATIIFFVLGALMTAGIGLYAPAMVVVYSMGMDPAAAFPIMMGSCALLMPVASAKFIKEDNYAKLNSIVIAVTGLLGVIVAKMFFNGLDVNQLKILVIVVVSVTGIIMLRSAFKNKVSKDTEIEG